MQEKRGDSIVIHTKLGPGTVPETGNNAGCAAHNGKWRRLRKKGRAAVRSRSRTIRRPNMGERLMRNSTVACCLLLGVLALGRIDKPWARNTLEKVEAALTMRIELDRSLGSLSFVKNLVPESALVFFNVTGETEFCRPLSGQIQHPWSEAQPWLLLACEEGETVYAVQSGTVTAISQLSGGGWGLIIDHGEGVESIYAYLDMPEVKTGEKLVKGQTVAKAQQGTNVIYYELRVGGAAADPAHRMQL